MPMIIRWGKLIHHCIGLACFLELCRAIIVQDMMLGLDDTVIEVINKFLISLYQFPCLPVSHWFCQNGITVNFGQDDNVLIALAGNFLVWSM